jgi:hypothetical protein
MQMISTQKNSTKNPCNNTRIVNKSTASRSVAGLDTQLTIDDIRDQLDQDEAASSAMRASMEMLILVVYLLLNRPSFNSHNSSKPPVTSPNRMKPLPESR